MGLKPCEAPGPMDQKGFKKPLRALVGSSGPYEALEGHIMPLKAL